MGRGRAAWDREDGDPRSPAALCSAYGFATWPAYISHLLCSSIIILYPSIIFDRKAVVTVKSFKLYTLLLVSLRHPIPDKV